jgi:hypothetical protein
VTSLAKISKYPFKKFMNNLKEIMFYPREIENRVRGKNYEKFVFMHTKFFAGECDKV